MSESILRQAWSMIDKDSSFQWRRRKALIAENACSIGFKSGEYGGKNRSLQSKFYVSIEGIEGKRWQLTCFVFYKFSNGIGMMNVAVIEDENTPWTWIWICKWDL